ncbi:hypothetical protein [Mycobacterium marinum]|uniref:hypothetical protein n=1 Tax=Mycobacterium marinum TaxID=1781 RepID=UPI0021C33B0D|nr:hypothetical protein [Mycobacterium marinum]
MAKTRVGRVYPVRFVPPPQMSLFVNVTVAEILVERLSPGNRVPRYGREWIIGRTQIEDRVLSGRLGFVAEGAVTEVWDEGKKDFRDETTQRGVTTTFAVNLDQLTAFIQERSDIHINSAIAALEEILNEGRKQKDLRWSIESRKGTQSLQRWLETVQKVTAVRLKVRRPNPKWQDAKNLQELMERAEAEIASIELENENGIDVNSDFIAQTQNHIDRGYGDGRYEGIRTDEDGDHRTTFSTRVGAEELHDEAPTTESGEVDEGVLRSRLVEETQSEETGDDDR